MSKVVKGFIIAACVCILIGIVMIAGVMASGGAGVVADVMQDGVYFSDDGFHVGGMTMFEDTSDMDITKGKELEFSADEIDNLNIELKAGTFEIVEGDTDKIIIRSAKEIKASKTGNTLKVKTPDGVHFIGINNSGNRVEITLPKEKVFHTIDLEIGAGELDVDTLRAEKIELEVGAGVIEVYGYQCKDGKLSVGAGEILVMEGTADTLNLDVGMGDLLYCGTIAGNLDADCGMGNVDLELTGFETDYNYKIDCGMGDITIGESSYGGVATSKTINHDASVGFDLDCGMGSINIEFTR